MTNAGEECISMITGAFTLQQIKNARSFLILTSAQERKKKNIWCLESDNITLTVSRLKATDCAHCCDWSPSLKLTPLSEEREMLLFDGDRGNVRLSSASALQNLRKALMCTLSYFDLLILTHLQQAWIHLNSCHCFSCCEVRAIEFSGIIGCEKDVAKSSCFSDK